VAQSIITIPVYALQVRPFRLVLIASSPTVRGPNAMTIICPGILLRVKIAQSKRLVVRPSLAVVSDELETANHLSDSEESKTFGEYDTTGNDLSGAEVSCLLQEVLWRLEDAAILDRSPEVLVVRLKSSNGASESS
jgi:hypothetical protein